MFYSSDLVVARETMEARRNSQSSSSSTTSNNRRGGCCLGRAINKYCTEGRIMFCFFVILAGSLVINVSLLARPHKPCDYSVDPCPRRWIGYGKLCHYESTDKVTWKDAHAACLSLGGTLGYFYGSDSQYLVQNKTLPSNDHWSDLYVTQNRTWLYTHLNGMPPPNTNYTCGYFTSSGFSDTNCTVEKKFFCTRKNHYATQYYG